MKNNKESKIMVEKILGSISDVSGKRLELDPVIMDHLQIQRPHQKTNTKNGRTVAISLDQGAALEPGAVLYMDDKVVVFIDLMEEEVLEIHPHGNLEWGKAAYNIGNMHQTAYLYETFIRCPYDSILERMMMQMGIPYQRTAAKLDGLRANQAAGGSHGAGGSHNHGDSHHHGE